MLTENYPRIEGLSVGAAAGHYSLPKASGVGSYNDFAATLKKKIDKYTLMLQWTDTNHRYTGTSIDDNHWIVTAQVDF